MSNVDKKELIDLIYKQIKYETELRLDTYKEKLEHMDTQELMNELYKSRRI